ncbi:MAG: hypothetical protein JWP91_2630 [Fibrobacteres bacterium]|nr:hypothetical protein [Fibrobacterota bacterium]
MHAFKASLALSLALSLAASLCPGATGTTDAAVPAAPLAPYRGTAFDTERKVFAYTEEHAESYDQGRHVATKTCFRAQDGKEMAERELDFHRFDCKPDYLFKDLRNGYEEGAEVGASGIKVHFRDSRQAAVHEKSIQVPEPCIINGGVGEFVRRNWAALEAGKRIGFNMVVPARLDYYKFVAYQDPKSGVPETEVAGRKHKAVIIEPQSSVLRMLLPTIIMYYDVKTLRLVRYQGIVNVADSKGRSLRVRVDYPGMGP